jgi:DNA topoisomerase-1
MGKILVIVESPAKARTLSKFLGADYTVESSIGHVRDLPSKAAEIPDAYRKKPWARLGVDVEDDFKPLYIVPAEKRKHVKKLKDLLKKAEVLYLATDEDREGEAIAWHLIEVLKPKVPVKRMVFHEITKKAVQQALEHTRELDTRLVEAQEARRILDRLFGYEISPVLWKKVRPRLSAGRVQSVATRLVVQRELARRAFNCADYWNLEAKLTAPKQANGPASVTAGLTDVAGRRVAAGRDFDAATGELSADATAKNVIQLDEKAARSLEQALTGAELTVESVTKKPFTRRPAPPFITSTLQQEAGRKLGFTAQRSMRVAQRLYENGYITYMRTDATTLSEEAVAAARKQIGELYGADYLPESARLYQKKVKGAQEAHEAIRPAGDTFRTPEQLRDELDPEALKLYELIWKRTIASQMMDAKGERSRIRFAGDIAESVSKDAGQPVHGSLVLSATGKVITFPGFLRAYVEGSDDPEAELGDKEVLLPVLVEGQRLPAHEVAASGHTTKPPARFTEASLVKELEQLGIGRPSTYASTIQTIQDRGYVWKKHGALMPTLTALAVTRLLEQHFEELVDYAFTARMESDLDAISSGEKQASPWLRLFYFGERNGAAPREDATMAPLSEVGIQAKIEKGIEEIDARTICAFPLGELDGEVVAARVGRYGPYLQIGDSDERTSLAEEMPIDELDLDMASLLLAQARVANRVLGEHPETGETIKLRSGRYGPYVQLGEPSGNGKKKVKPRMSGLWPGMEPATISLDDALLLLSYPKVLGDHPEHQVPIVADNGQYGPYITMEVDGKKDSRSLEDHETLRSIDLSKALELLSQPKQRRRQGASRSILAELEVSPVTGKPITVRNGRFGPYVTDGQVNASIRSSRDPATITFDDALELIAAREQRLRDQGKEPREEKKAAARKKPAKKKPAKKAAKKKPAKKAAKKKPAKKAAKKAAKKKPAKKSKTT